MLRRSPLSPKRTRPRRKGEPSPRIKPRRLQDRDHLERVRQLGCVVCGAKPCEAHHVRDGAGMGQKASDHEAIPLCPTHHRTGGPGLAYHAGPREWEAIHGKQRDHLQATLQALGMGTV